jgi:hypothetical protein
MDRIYWYTFLCNLVGFLMEHALGKKVVALNRIFISKIKTEHHQFVFSCVALCESANESFFFRILNARKPKNPV